MKKEVTHANSMDEVVAAEAVDRETDCLPRSTTAATRMEPVRKGMTGDNAEEEDVTEEGNLCLRAIAGT